MMVVPRQGGSWLGRAIDLLDPRDVELYLARHVQAEGDCWVWSTGAGKYADVRTSTYSGRAHRWSYEFHRAEIPEGLTLDHLCRNTRRVNPWHLEPVPLSVNIRRAHDASRGTHCPSGHEYTPENTASVAGKRRCRACHRARERARSRIAAPKSA